MQTVSVNINVYIKIIIERILLYKIVVTRFKTVDISIYYLCIVVIKKVLGTNNDLPIGKPSKKHIYNVILYEKDMKEFPFS